MTGNFSLSASSHTAKSLSIWSAFVAPFLITAALLLYFYGSLMHSPNERAPTFGGDGLTIHYNLQYHATYGEGLYLTSQYYPERESIFMTDAQGVLAVGLASLRPVFPSIGTYAVGISNSLIIWSTPIAAVLLFLLFWRLKVNYWLALVLRL